MSYNFWRDKHIVVTGGAGFLGSNLVAELKKRGAKKILIPRQKLYDLRVDKACVKATKGAQIVFHLAGNVGGIGFNKSNPATLLYDNLLMGVNLIEACRKNLVGKLVNIGTICSYPKHTPTPFTEDNLWNGYPEETNAPYGIAKKALIIQAKAYHEQFGMNIINLLPVNLYGPGDHFDPKISHVIPALIKKFIDAKMNRDTEVKLWGSGNATREFLYVTDAAQAIVDAAENLNSPDPVNLGSGSEISIRELALTIKNIIGYEGFISWDTTQPDGQPRRFVDSSKARELFNFTAPTDLHSGLKRTIDWYLKHFHPLSKSADSPNGAPHPLSQFSS